jgi:hypothetical protein
LAAGARSRWCSIHIGAFYFTRRDFTKYTKFKPSEKKYLVIKENLWRGYLELPRANANPRYFKIYMCQFPAFSNFSFPPLDLPPASFSRKAVKSNI